MKQKNEMITKKAKMKERKKRRKSNAESKGRK